MKTIGEILSLAKEYLEKAQVERSRRMAEELLAFILGWKRIDLYLSFDKPLEEIELSTYRSFLKRKAQGEPLEYIMGKVEFFGCSITVNPAVLIPRPETEILLDKVCREIQDVEGKEAWDLCCGSGCLGIGLKKRRPGIRVTLADVSGEALKVARENVEANQVECTLLEGDLLAPFAGRKADFVLCNPPYLSEEEYQNLDRLGGKEVRLFEPRLALVGGKTGLEFYTRLAEELPDYLKPAAQVFFEIGKDQGEAVCALFKEPIWEKVRVEKDWAGHDRFFSASFSLK